jgi:hypothetical protein
LTYPVDKNGDRLHIIAASNAYGGKLPLKSRVHHFDCDYRNYKNNNLVVCNDDAYHRLIHIRTSAFNICGNANYRKCDFCKVWDDPSNMTKIKGRATYYHKKCNTKHHAERRLRLKG